jgi:hypothetical protein
LQVVAPDYLPPAPGEVSLQDILARADKEPALDDTERRREAKRLVRTAVADVNRITSDDHLRYELALLVVNENVEAMQDMKDVAAASGLPVKEYAKRAIAIHNVRRRRAAQVYGIEQTALNEIDAAVGDRIEAVAAKAVSDIRGEDE